MLYEIEQQPQLADVYRRMAESENRHADFWEDKLRAVGGRTVRRKPE